MEILGAGLKVPAVEVGLAIALAMKFLPLSVDSPWVASRLLVLMLSLLLSANAFLDASLISLMSFMSFMSFMSDSWLLSIRRRRLLPIFKLGNPWPLDAFGEPVYD